MRLQKVRFAQKWPQFGDPGLQRRNFAQKLFRLRNPMPDGERGKDRFELKKHLIGLCGTRDRKLRREKNTLMIAQDAIGCFEYAHRFFSDHVGEQKQPLPVRSQIRAHRGRSPLTRRFDQALVERLEAQEEIFLPFKHIRASVR
jgi:hypothetical protein